MMKKPRPSITDALIEISHAQSSGTNLLSILSLIKDVAVRLMDAERASIFLIDSQQDELWTLIADGADMIRIPRGKGIVGEVIDTNSPVTVSDTSKDSRFFPDIDRKTGFTTRSILCVPLRNRSGTALGAVEVLNKSNGLFESEDERFLEVLGTQAGWAIENVEMYEDIQQNLSQLHLLLDLQDRVNMSMRMDQVFSVFLSKLLPVIDGTAGIIRIGSLDERPTYFGYTPEDGLICRETDQIESVGRLPLRHLLQDIEQNRGCVPNQTFFQAEDLVYAELLRGKTSLGFLAVRLNLERKRLFNERPLEYVKVIAGQTVSFLEKKKALDLQKRNEKQALLGSMLSRVVHDMKNPLSGISGYAQLIRRKTRDDRLKSHCDTILEALGTLDKMNGDLLTYVRGEKPALERSEVAIFGLLSKLIESTGESDRIAGITIELSGESEALVWGDRDRLSRVFTNLLSNAREAMPKGGTITIWVEQKSPVVQIRIQDSGPGIPGHLRKRIFDPFVSHGKTNGTGLGLAIAKSIVEEHGGDISLHGRAGNGTIFRVVLPRHLEEENET